MFPASHARHFLTLLVLGFILPGEDELENADSLEEAQIPKDADGDVILAGRGDKKNEGLLTDSRLGNEKISDRAERRGLTKKRRPEYERQQSPRIPFAVRF